MKDLSALVANLKIKAEKLVEKHQVVIEQNKQLLNEVLEFKVDLNKRNQQLSEMENKIKVLKISKSVDSESTKDVKLKINEMVREIDKCIAQINK